MNPFTTTSTDTLTDTRSNNGIYYYVIVAGDTYVNSSFSNCEYVTIGIPLNKTVLYQISPNPSQTGIINLNWSPILEATLYYVYRENSPINSSLGLIPIAISLLSNYTDNITVEDTYYYAIVAADPFARGRRLHRQVCRRL